MIWNSFLRFLLIKSKQQERRNPRSIPNEIYDIVPDEKQTILPADFVIVEGINVFQNPQNDSLYMTDFFDFSIYGCCGRRYRILVYRSLPKLLLN